MQSKPPLKTAAAQRHGDIPLSRTLSKKSKKVLDFYRGQDYHAPVFAWSRDRAQKFLRGYHHANFEAHVSRLCLRAKQVKRGLFIFMIFHVSPWEATMPGKFQFLILLLAGVTLLPAVAFAQSQDTLYLRSKVGAFKLMDRGFGFLGTSRHHNKEAEFTNFVNYHAAFALWVGAITASGEMRVTSGSSNASDRIPEWAPRSETFRVNSPAALPSVEKNTFASYGDELAIEGHKPLGLSVEQNVYGMKDGKFAIVDFALSLSNPAGELKDFYAGFWSDIDVPSEAGKDTPDDDKIAFASNGDAILVYDGEATGESLPLLGAMILGTDTPIVSWWQDGSDPKDDAQEYSYLAGENERVPPETPGDYRFLLSYGPFAMSAGETIHFAVVLTQANDRNAVEDNFAAAEEFYKNELGLTGLPKKQEKLVEAGNMPADYGLYPNFPNPFNPTTEIRFDLPEAAYVQLLIYDLSGRVVRHLIEAEYQPGSIHPVNPS